MAASNLSGLNAGVGNDQNSGGQTTFGSLGNAAGATGVNVQGSTGTTIDVSSASADAELYMTANAAMAGEQATAQEAETQNYNLASLVAQSNPGVNAYSASTQMSKENYEFIATSIFALVALAAWWIYRK